MPTMDDPANWSPEEHERLNDVDTANFQQIAASQLQLMFATLSPLMAQSRQSFFLALFGSVLSLMLFAFVVIFSLVHGVSIIPMIASAAVNVASGIVFVLYGKTSNQMSEFNSRVHELQRYLLANSIAETLSDAERDKARLSLIAEISRSRHSSPRSVP
jgi:hypothetical protein